MLRQTFYKVNRLKEQSTYVPPKEANKSNIWKLQTFAYGLVDASRYWYLHVREELVRLGAKLSSIDPGIFYWQDDSGLIGIFVCYVNNMIPGKIEYFKTNVIDILRSTFKFGSEETYV